VNTQLSRALAAELIGTFALVFIGAGAGAIALGGLVGIALAFGLVVVCLAYAFGHISGTHLNPAVSIGLWLTGQLKPVAAVGYIVVQCLGAVLAAFALAWVLGGTGSGLGMTVLSSNLEVGNGAVVTITPIIGVVVEAILTFLLVNTILNTAVTGKAGDLAGLAIGLTLAFCILMGGPLTGASLNPARSLGPAVATGDYQNLWVYVVGPILGAALAALVYRGLWEER
jgi:aquaporin Z